jgi:anaerobic magnesium-protoporphyrin IX monomethyl ester cyclase
MKDISELKANPGKHKLDVLLINPGSLNEVYQDLGKSYSAVETPTLAALFATYVRKKGFAVDLIDAPAFGLSAKDVAELVNEHFDPVLVVLVVYGFQPSASTQNMPSAGATCAHLKKLNPDIKIMMTGTHPAALPERTIREEAVDFVCDREGPETILQTMLQLKSLTGDLTRVPSLWYWEGETLRNTETDPLMGNLDEEMPEPAYDLLPMDKYRAHNWHCFDHINERQPYASMITSLGCPYKCSFCCINAPFGRSSYRMWSPDTVIKQIDTLVNEYGVKNIKFVDEMFVLNTNHVMGICDHIIERGYDLNIWAYARVDTVKEEQLAKMKQAGIRWLALGIESGSKHVRDGVEKGRFGTEAIIEVVSKIQAAGIYVIGNYIFGLPDDTHKSMEDTLQLALEANCEFANFYSAMAYPGSKLYTQAVNEGWSLPESWIGFSQHSYECTPLPTETLSSAEVLKFRDEAFQRYFSDQGYLSYVKEKFGEDVCKHLSEVASVPLPRQLYSQPA